MAAKRLLDEKNEWDQKIPLTLVNEYVAICLRQREDLTIGRLGRLKNLLTHVHAQAHFTDAEYDSALRTLVKEHTDNLMNYRFCRRLIVEESCGWITGGVQHEIVDEPDLLAAFLLLGVQPPPLTRENCPPIRIMWGNTLNHPLVYAAGMGNLEICADLMRTLLPSFLDDEELKHITRAFRAAYKYLATSKNKDIWSIYALQRELAEETVKCLRKIFEAMVTAASHGKENVIRWLLSDDYNQLLLTHFHEEHREQLLEAAIRGGHTATINLVIGHCATKRLFHKLLLRAAARTDNVALVKKVFEENESLLVLQRGSFGDALSIAATEGNMAVVKYLLTISKTPNAPTSTERYNALVMAARYGHTAVVRFLLEQGAQIRPKARTAWTVAARGGHAAVIDILLEFDKELIDLSPYDSPLVEASHHGWSEVVDRLLHSGLDFHHTYRRAARIALGYAAHGGHTSVISALVNAGISPSPPITFYSPLVEAVAFKQIHAAIGLIELGAKIPDTLYEDVSRVIHRCYYQFPMRCVCGTRPVEVYIYDFTGAILSEMCDGEDEIRDLVARLKCFAGPIRELSGHSPNPGCASE